MKPPTIDPALVSALKRLKLGHIADALPERIMLADKQGMAVQEFLLLVLSDEITRRDSSSTDRRAKDAALDPTMRIERWDKTAKVTYDKRVFAELTSLRFVEAHQHVIVLGPVGVGKAFLGGASDTLRADTATKSSLYAQTRCYVCCVKVASTIPATCS